MDGFVDNWGINSYYVMLKFVSSTLTEERYPHIHKAHFYPPIDFRRKIRYTDEAHKNLGERQASLVFVMLCSAKSRTNVLLFRSTWELPSKNCRGRTWRNFYLKTLRVNAVYLAALLSIQRPLSRWQIFCTSMISIVTPTAPFTKLFSNCTSSANPPISLRSLTS